MIPWPIHMDCKGGNLISATVLCGNGPWKSILYILFKLWFWKKQMDSMFHTVYSVRCQDLEFIKNRNSLYATSFSLSISQIFIKLCYVLFGFGNFRQGVCGPLGWVFLFTAVVSKENMYRVKPHYDMRSTFFLYFWLPLFKIIPSCLVVTYIFACT